MFILLDCRPLQQAGADSEKTQFILVCAAGLSVHHGVEWLFLLDKKSGELLLPPGGEQRTYKSLPGAAGRKLWQDWVIPRIARSHKADMVMTTEGGRRTGNTKPPQCSWTLSPKGFFLSYSGKQIPVPMAPDKEVGPLTPEMREKVKEGATEGKEYFFSDIKGLDPSGIVNLLKAFSFFKKRQLSNMKLVLAGAGVIDKLDSYKYRQDICLVPEAKGGLMEGAYAVINLPRRDTAGIGVLNAWKARVPVIGFGAGEGVLQVQPGDPALLADGLKSLYKDEALRNELIGKGVVAVNGLDIRQSVATIWDAIGRNQ